MKDGALLILSSVISATRAGALTQKQAHSIHNAITAVFVNPKITFNAAMHWVDGMENAGLAVEPEGFEELAAVVTDLDHEAVRSEPRTR